MLYLLCPLQPAPKADNGGYAILPPGWSHPCRRLESSVIILGRKGTVLLTEENEPVEIKPNRLILLTAGKLHYGKQPIEHQASYYWFHFTLPNPPVFLSEVDIATILRNPYVTSQRLAEAAILPQQLDLRSSELLISQFRELLHEQEQPCYTRWRLQLLFHNLLISITEETIKAYRTPTDIASGSSLVYEIIAEVTSNFVNPNLSVKSIAASLNHNPDYIGRQFRTVMGLSIGEYILQQRMKLAEKYLQDSHETIAGIAEKCGFASVRHFLRQFKKEWGITPSELRKKYSSIHINTR